MEESWYTFPPDTLLRLTAIAIETRGVSLLFLSATQTSRSQLYKHLHYFCHTQDQPWELDRSKPRVTKTTGYCWALDLVLGNGGSLDCPLSSVIMSHGSPSIWQVEARDIAVSCPPTQLSSCKRSVLLRTKSRAGGSGQPRVLGCISEFLICVA